MDSEELRRLDALRRYAILDTPPEPNFDRITRLASSIFNHPVCTLALADRDRFWFKSRYGVDATEMPRHMAFCDQTIQGSDVFVVRDASKDHRFAEAPVVAGPPHFRFYAGAPLVTPSGSRIGSLCVLDTEPQAGFSVTNQEILSDLAVTVVELLEARTREIELSRCTGEIAHLARHDPLTGLPNRRRLGEVSGEVCRRAGTGEATALLYLDLDGFKAVNDRHGHACGDELLRQVADRLRAALPVGAHVARLGGDEFAVLIQEEGGVERAALALAQTLVWALGRPYQISGHRLEIGVSIGIACGEHGTDLDEALREADAALYIAKAQGRGRYAFATRAAA